jgi:hypothetical protein
MNVPDGPDNTVLQLNGPFRADDLQTRRFSKVTGDTQRRFDAEHDLVAAGQLNLIFILPRGPTSVTVSCAA